VGPNPTLTPAKLHEAFPGAEIIVYGHTHRPLLEFVDKTVSVMSPGGQGRRGSGSCPCWDFEQQESLTVLKVMATPSPRQVRAGAKHVDAEIDMLVRTAEYLRHPTRHGATHDYTIRRAILESWAIHLRCLIEFFHPKRTDVLRAEHYVADAVEWLRTCPKLNKQEQRRQKALHELLAHIAIGRDARKSRWSEADHRIVTRRIPLFLAHLTSRRRSWFPEATHLFPQHGAGGGLTSA